MGWHAAGQQGEGVSQGRGASGFMSAIVAGLVLTPVSCRVTVGGVSTTGPVLCPVLQLLNDQEIPI